MVRLLLARQGVEVNNSTPDGYTALYVASLNGRVEVARLLLARQDVKTGSTTTSGWSALGAALRGIAA